MMKELKGKKRILIVGCCGAGKTTLALRLGRELNLPGGLKNPGKGSMRNWRKF